MKLKLLVFVSVITTCSQFSIATNYYVDINNPIASDTNPGTEALPFATIQRGIDAAFSGDSVYVKEGDYNQDYTGLEMKRSGVQDSLIVFKALGDVKVFFPVDLNKGWRWSTLYNNFLVIDGFEIIGGKYAVLVQGDYNEVLNCKIHDTGSDALSIWGGSYNRIAYNEVYNAGWNGIHIEEREYNGSQGNAHYNIVEHNNSHNNPIHFGINIFPETTQQQTELTGNIIRYNQIYNNLGGIYLRNFKDGFIYGNLIYDNSNNGIFLHHLDQASNQFPSNLKIYNNTLVNNTPFNSINNASFIDVEIKNNIFIQQSLNPCIKSDNTQGVDIDYNLYHNPSSVFIIRWGTENLRFSAAQGYGLELNGFEANPILGLDFKAQATSPALDNGIDLVDFFSLDPEGNIRGEDGAWDIGAFEGNSNLIATAKIKIMMEGAYLNGRMQTTLNQSSLLPLRNPYDDSPWKYEIGDSVLSFTPDIVDWVLIELRSTLGNVNYRSAALVNREGFITDLSGNTPYTFYNIPQDSFFIAIYHRNHLPIISSQKVHLSTTISNYNFTTAVDQAYGTDAMKDLGGNVFGMYAGDANKSLIITAADKRQVNFYNSDTGYLYADTNMDGIVDETDKQFIINNKMNGSYVP